MYDTSVPPYVDTKRWEQAFISSPDPETCIPVALVGTDELKKRFVDQRERAEWLQKCVKVCRPLQLDVLDAPFLLNVFLITQDLGSKLEFLKDASITTSLNVERLRTKQAALHRKLLHVMNDVFVAAQL